MSRVLLFETFLCWSNYNLYDVDADEDVQKGFLISVDADRSEDWSPAKRTKVSDGIKPCSVKKSWIGLGLHKSWLQKCSMLTAKPKQMNQRSKSLFLVNAF